MSNHYHIQDQKIQNQNHFQWMDEYEYKLCLSINRYAYNRYIRNIFALISRLGNGVFWYVLIALLPFLYGAPAITVSITMLCNGLAGVIIYKYLKNRLTRKRPCIHYQSIYQATEMLDYYSFPSGHTLHAFSFSLIALEYYPELAIILIPFTALVALSRIILGLHYPSDVLAGAALGMLLAAVSLNITSIII